MSAKLKLDLVVDDKGSVTITEFSSTTQKRMKMAKKSVVALGAALTGLTAATAAAIKKSVDEYAVFETALVDMGKVTAQPLQQIRKDVMSIDPALGSATELMQGYYQVISAGVTEPSAALDMLKVSAKAANAAHLEQSETIKGLTKVMAGYKGEIETASDAADLLFQIEKQGQTSVAELIPVIGGLAAMSKDLGVQQEELGGALAQITQTAGTTSEAATQYQSVLTALMKPSKAMSEALFSMGHESAQAAIEAVGFSGTLQKLQQWTGGSAEKMAALFGRVEALKGMSALASGDFKHFNQQVAGMGERAGSSAKAFDDWKGTFEAVKSTFGNTINKIAIEFGTAIAPALKRAMEKISSYVEKNRGKFAEWAKTVEKIFNNVETTLKVITPAVKFMAKAFVKTGEAIGISMAKVAAFIDKIKALTKIKIKIPFLGSGSTTRPLSEKIDEMKGKFDWFYGAIGDPRTALIHFTGNAGTGQMPATQAIGVLEDFWVAKAEAIKGNVPDIKVNTTPSTDAIDLIKAALENQVGEGGAWPTWKGAVETLTGGLYANLKQGLDDFFFVMLKENEGTLGAIKRALEDSVKTDGAWPTWEAEVIKIAGDAGAGAKSALSQSLFVAIKGDMDQFEIIWQGFLDSLLKSFTDTVADMVVSELVEFGGNLLFDILSADTGIWKIKKDQVVQVHEGEMILPKDVSEQMRKYFEGPGAGPDIAPALSGVTASPEAAVAFGRGSGRSLGISTISALAAYGTVPVAALPMMGMKAFMYGMNQAAMSITNAQAIAANLIEAAMIGGGYAIGGPIGAIIAGLLSSILGPHIASALGFTDQTPEQSFEAAQGMFGGLQGQEAANAVGDLSGLSEGQSAGALFHTGGFLGLKNDEGFFVGQTGEGVLSRRGMTALDQLNQGQAPGGSGPIYITVEIGGQEFDARIKSISDGVRVKAAARGIGNRRMVFAPV